jgi:hypothetical protein
MSPAVAQQPRAPTAVSPKPREAATDNFGPRPQLRWLPIDSLTVDRTYQRTLDSKASQRSIARIAGEFRWSAFQAILVTPALADDFYLILDGQHRVEGARRAGHGEVPAVIVATASTAEQASAFARANRDRVAVNAFALHHALLAAADAAAGTIDGACRAAGIEIPRYPIPADKLKPGQTMALATIAEIVARHGIAVAVPALVAVADAYREESGRLRAPLLRAVAAIVAERPGYHEARLTAILRPMTARQLDDAVHDWRASHVGSSAAALTDFLRGRLGLAAATGGAKREAVRPPSVKKAPARARPKPARAPKPLRPDPDADLRRLHAEGKGVAAIAAAIGKGVEATGNRIALLGLNATPEARGGERALIDAAIAAGKVRRVPSAGELAAMMTGVPAFTTLDDAAAWLARAGCTVKKVSNHRYRVDNRPLPASALCEHARGVARKLALAKWERQQERERKAR